MIRLVTKKDGRTVINNTAKPGVTVSEICEIAENEFYGGYADNVQGIVKGKIYMELES